MVNVRKPSLDVVGAVIRLKNMPDSALFCQVPWLFCFCFKVRLWNRATSFNAEGFVDAHAGYMQVLFICWRDAKHNKLGTPTEIWEKKQDGPGYVHSTLLRGDKMIALSAL